MLAQCVSFGRDAADDAVGRSQLLHHHVEMTIESAQGWIVFRAGHGSRGVLLLSARTFQRAGSAIGFLARHTDNERFSGSGSAFWYRC